VRKRYSLLEGLKVQEKIYPDEGRLESAWDKRNNRPAIIERLYLGKGRSGEGATKKNLSNAYHLVVYAMNLREKE